jgi:hypothetical protein
MTRALPLIFVAVLFGLLVNNAPAQSSVDSTLRAVEALYSSGSYSLAELEARRLIENDLLSDSLRVVAEQWVAFSLVAQGKPALAKEHFTTILRRQPSYELDPILTSPKILVVFSEARTAFRAAVRSRNDSSDVLMTAGTESVTFRTIVFPGWEQWHHGRSTTGKIFAGAGMVTLGSGIALEFLRSAARREYLAATQSGDIESKYQTYNRYAKAEVYAFAAFALVYLASEIDVFTHGSPVSLTAGVTNPSVASSGLMLTVSLR